MIDLNQIILRDTAHPPLTNKGDILTKAEIDKNFYTIYDFLIELQELANIPEYDSEETYVGGDIVKFGTKLYRQAYDGSPSEVTGIEPTNETYWQETSIGEAAHLKNHDDMLASGTSNQVTAAELRYLLDFGGSGGGSDTFVCRAHPDVTADSVGKLASISAYGFSGEDTDLYVNVYERQPETTGSPWEFEITVDDISQKVFNGKSLKFTANLNDGDTILIRESLFWRGSKTFTFKNSLASPPDDGEIQIGATLSDTMTSAWNVINDYFTANLLENVLAVGGFSDGLDIYSLNPPSWYEEVTAYNDVKQTPKYTLTVTCTSAVLRPVSSSFTKARLAYRNENDETEVWEETAWNHVGAPNGVYPLTADEEAENIMEFLDAELNVPPIVSFAFARVGNVITITTVEPIIDDGSSGINSGDNVDPLFISLTDSITAETITDGQKSKPERSTLQFCGTIISYDEEAGTVTVRLPRFAKYRLDSTSEVNLSSVGTGTYGVYSAVMVCKDGDTVGNVSSGLDFNFGLVGIAMNNAQAGEEVWVWSDLGVLQFLDIFG